MVEPGAIPHFERFVGRMKERLDAGRQEYGDRSFAIDPQQLIREIQEELVDTANWSLILYGRLQAIQDALSVRRPLTDLPKRKPRVVLYGEDGDEGGAA